MKFGWETEEARLRRQIAIPPKKKLEWLWQINCFVRKYSVARNSVSRK
ncbi:MAG: hypothetical protein H6754_09080 [Candidatus Omnitrophica bacterium]|nr:hypothetical protein [Candidatus Omnitrophota bacterium]